MLDYLYSLVFCSCRRIRFLYVWMDEMMIIMISIVFYIQWKGVLEQLSVSKHVCRVFICYDPVPVLQEVHSIGLGLIPPPGQHCQGGPSQVNLSTGLEGWRPYANILKHSSPVSSLYPTYCIISAEAAPQMAP